MTTVESADTATIPDEIARRIILPEGHNDEAKLYEAYRWLRETSRSRRREWKDTTRSGWSASTPI